MRFAAEWVCEKFDEFPFIAAADALIWRGLTHLRAIKITSALKQNANISSTAREGIFRINFPSSASAYSFNYVKLTFRSQLTAFSFTTRVFFKRWGWWNELQHNSLKCVLPWVIKRSGVRIERLRTFEAKYFPFTSTPWQQFLRNYFHPRDKLLARYTRNSVNVDGFTFFSLMTISWSICA